MARLPGHIQVQAREAYRRFQSDPYHPSLRFKLVHPSLPVQSVRITTAYRALGVRDGDTIVWFWIGSHADYDRLVSRL